MKDWIIKHKILTGVVVLFLIGFINTSSVKNNQQSESPTPKTIVTQKPTASITKPSPTEFKPKTKTERDLEGLITEAAKPRLKVSINFNNKYLFIKNEEGVELDQCTVYIPNVEDQNNFGNDTGLIINPNETVSIAWFNLTRLDGTRFDYFKTKPETIQISCMLSNIQETHWETFTIK